MKKAYKRATTAVLVFAAYLLLLPGLKSQAEFAPIGAQWTYRKCHHNTNTPYSNDIRVDQGKIAFFQIDPGNVAAGNVFTPCEAGLTHIDNLLGNSIRYYFWEQGVNEEPVCSPAFKVDRIPDEQNLCSKGGDIPAEEADSQTTGHFGGYLCKGVKV